MNNLNNNDDLNNSKYKKFLQNNFYINDILSELMLYSEDNDNCYFCDIKNGHIIFTFFKTAIDKLIKEQEEKKDNE